MTQNMDNLTSTDVNPWSHLQDAVHEKEVEKQKSSPEQRNEDEASLMESSALLTTLSNSPQNVAQQKVGDLDCFGSGEGIKDKTDIGDVCYNMSEYLEGAGKTNKESDCEDLRDIISHVPHVEGDSLGKVSDDHNEVKKEAEVQKDNEDQQLRKDNLRDLVQEQDAVQQIDETHHKTAESFKGDKLASLTQHKPIQKQTEDVIAGTENTDNSIEQQSVVILRDHTTSSENTSSVQIKSHFLSELFDFLHTETEDGDRGSRMSTAPLNPKDENHGQKAVSSASGSQTKDDYHNDNYPQVQYRQNSSDQPKAKTGQCEAGPSDASNHGEEKTTDRDNQPSCSGTGQHLKNIPSVDESGSSTEVDGICKRTATTSDDMASPPGCQSIVEKEDDDDDPFPEVPAQNLTQRNSSKKTTIHRKDSTSTYKRRITTPYELEKVIELHRPSRDEHYGFHLKDQHPVFVSSIEDNSLAATAGIKPKDAILAVNGKDVVLEAHQNVVKQIDKDPSLVILVVAPLDMISDVVTPTMRGILEKRSSRLRTWKRYWFELKEDGVLYYYKNDMAASPSAAIYLKAFSVDKCKDVHNGFRLWKCEMEFVLRAKDEEQVKMWIEALNTAIHIVTITNPSQMVSTGTQKVVLNRHAISDPDCYGTLEKQGGSKKVWRTRYCILKNASLYYYSSKEKDVAKGVAHFHGYKVMNGIANSRKSHGFTLTPPMSDMREYYFSAKDEETKHRWMQAFETSINKWVTTD